MTFPNQLVPFLRVVLQPECPAKVSPVPEGTRLIAGEPGDSQPERATQALRGLYRQHPTEALKRQRQFPPANPGYPDTSPSS
jgi:hypothetical protein